MRVTPTREQMAYLASIGVSSETIAQSGSAPSPIGADASDGSYARRMIRWWAIMLVIAVVLLSLTGLACAMEPPPDTATSGEPPLQVAPDPSTRRLEAMEAEIAANKEAVGQRRLEAMETEIAAIKEAAGRRARIEQGRHMAAKLVEARVRALSGSVDQQREDFNQVAIWMLMIDASFIGLVITGRFLMETRMRQAEQAVLSGWIDTAQSATPVPRPKGAPMVVSEPTRPLQQPPPEPEKLMQSIVARAQTTSQFRVKPRLASKAWELGLARHKGYVRSENQDYGLCFQIGGHDVLIVADGCGGVPHGQRAAFLAVFHATISVARAYGEAPRWHTPHVKDAAAKAIVAAAHRLAVEGDKLNVTDIRGGLRTTLIVVIGNKREVGYAYIGDGGGCVVKTGGEVHRFLAPHKLNDFAMNVLSASLGPTMEGEPTTGVLKREPGDIIVVGTDGVFDRVDKTFPKDVLRGCIQYAGDLQKTAEHVLDELAGFQDGTGYVCDDNLTLGIMGDGTAPKLSPGFWSPAVEDTVAQAKAEMPKATATAQEGAS